VGLSVKIFLSYSNASQNIIQDMVSYLVPYARDTATLQESLTDTLDSPNSIGDQSFEASLVHRIEECAAVVVILPRQVQNRTGGRCSDEAAGEFRSSPPTGAADRCLHPASEFCTRLAATLGDAQVWRELRWGDDGGWKLENSVPETSILDGPVMLVFGRPLSTPKSDWFFASCETISDACALAMLPGAHLAMALGNGRLEISNTSLVPNIIRANSPLPRVISNAMLKPLRELQRVRIITSPIKTLCKLDLRDLFIFFDRAWNIASFNKPIVDTSMFQWKSIMNIDLKHGKDSTIAELYWGRHSPRNGMRNLLTKFGRQRGRPASWQTPSREAGTVSSLFWGDGAVRGDEAIGRQTINDIAGPNRPASPIIVDRNGTSCPQGSKDRNAAQYRTPGHFITREAQRAYTGDVQIKGEVEGERHGLSGRRRISSLAAYSYFTSSNAGLSSACASAVTSRQDKSMSDDIFDVFLSYCHEDLEQAKQLRTLLWSHGWSVFLDEDIPVGYRWDKELERKLDAARCVVALWSAASRASNVQFDEANFALSRAALMIARLDRADLPLGLRPVQYVDLTTWQKGEDHPGISRLFARVDELVRAAKAAPQPIGDIDRELTGRADSADRHSVSNRSADAEAILSALGDADRAATDAIREGYAQLVLAQREARLALDDEAPRDHYKNAANSLRQALLRLSAREKAAFLPRHNMPIGYFLKMEFANALVFSLVDNEPVSKEAFDTYEELAEAYPKDTAVFLRLGRARVKAARYAPPGLVRRETLEAAIRDLNRALSLAPFDGLVDPDHWVYFEAPLQIGICFWLVSEFPNVPKPKRIESLMTAIAHTEPVIGRRRPADDPDDFVKFITLRAAGNVIFYSALLIRAAAGAEEMESSIKACIRYLRADDSWGIVKNQPRIIDSIMLGAASAGDPMLALEMAKLNSENFRKISYERPLHPDEREMWARADETEFLLERGKLLFRDSPTERPASGQPRKRWWSRGAEE
jgi:tetratricopeptide (TPR) repeat protein